jgi:hypothetical protein
MAQQPIPSFAQERLFDCPIALDGIRLFGSPADQKEFGLSMPSSAAQGHTETLQPTGRHGGDGPGAHLVEVKSYFGSDFAPMSGSLMFVRP